MTPPDTLRVFVDTEFTQFTGPYLISVGAVIDEEHHFYGVVTDFPLRACSAFVREHVLPVIDAYSANIRGSLDRVAEAFADWLLEAAPVEAEIVVVADDEYDLELLGQMLRAYSVNARISYRRVPPVSGNAIKVDNQGKRSRRHNSLHDAWALFRAHT